LCRALGAASQRHDKDTRHDVGFGLLLAAMGLTTIAIPSWGLFGALATLKGIDNMGSAATAIAPSQRLSLAAAGAGTTVLGLGEMALMVWG